MNILQDERVRWIRQRVVMSLEIPTESFDQHFLGDTNESIFAREQFMEFFSGKHGSGSSIFFSSKKVVEDVEGRYKFFIISIF